jgi:hypothetical protein
MKIVVINNGFVVVCRQYTEAGTSATLTEVRCIRVWGTSNGLGELVGGPTPATVLDSKIPIVSVPLHQIVFTFDVTDAWDKHV